MEKDDPRAVAAELVRLRAFGADGLNFRALDDRVECGSKGILEAADDVDRGGAGIQAAPVELERDLTAPGRTLCRRWE